MAGARIPVADQVTSAVGTVLAWFREALAVTVLAYSVTRPADDRGEAAESDPVVWRHAESSQVDALGRAEAWLRCQPCVQGLLVEEELAAAASVPAAGRQLTDR
jgi:hypothetical protein